MGDVIKTFPVRTYEGEKPRRLRLYFDSGSPYTFIKRSACRGFRAVYDLPKPMSFGGLGDGKFYATRGAFLEVRLLGIWCRHAAYVVDDSVLTKDEDLLVGHDFMQKFDVDISSKRKDVVLRRTSLQSAQIVRRLRGKAQRRPDVDRAGSEARMTEDRHLEAIDVTATPSGSPVGDRIEARRVRSAAVEVPRAARGPEVVSGFDTVRGAMQGTGTVTGFNTVRTTVRTTES